MPYKANVYQDIKLDVSMTKEKEAAPEAEETEETLEEEVTEEKDEEPAEGNEEDKKSSEEPDEDSQQIEADLDRERKANAAFIARKKKREGKKGAEADDVEKDDGEEEAVNEDDKPLTRQEAKELRKTLLTSEASTYATRFSTNETEKALILEKWKNRTFPAHISLEEQIEECAAIAFRKKFIGERNEALRALKGMKTIVTHATSEHHDALPAPKTKMSGADGAEIARKGFVWSNTNRRYEKKLSNGQTLYLDPSTKRTVLI